MIIIQKTIALTFYILRLKTDMVTAKLVQLIEWRGSKTNTSG